MQLLVRNMAVGLSLTGIIVSPAFGFAGVGFPVLACRTFRAPGARSCRCAGISRSCSTRRTRGAAVQFTAVPFAILCGITVVLALLVWLRFRALVRAADRSGGGRSRRSARDARRRAAPSSAEWRRALGDRGVFSAVRPGTVALRVLLSAAVSRPDRARHADRGRRPGPQRTRPRADPGAGGARQHIGRAARFELREAEDAILARRAFAILGIPPDTEKNVLKGDRRGCRSMPIRPISSCSTDRCRES